jgi:2-C-methyl-D-erythritol 2,4-cyclodiphosphate synthase
MKFRVGFGYDVHKLQAGKNLQLGGIKIPARKSAVGHSDADILIHAICDALLGAANLRDIGFNFPDTEIEYKDIDSKVLLKTVISFLSEKGYKVGNIDSTICLQQPKLSGFIPEMKRVLASAIGIDDDLISIKATTTEKLGFVGKEQGIAAYAVTLIFKE